MTQKGAKGTSTCPHVDMVQLSWEEIKGTKPKCHDCDKVCSRAAWLCLFQDCQFVGCGHKLADHSSIHQRETGHPLCINLHNKRFWCRDCQQEVFEFGNRPQFTLRKFAAGFEQPLTPPPRRSAPAPAATADALDDDGANDVEDEEEEEEPESLGLTGLRNLGNTCYMNAAIQALSNCSQLTRFFLDCRSLARPGRFAARSLGTPLCTAYAALLAELWSPMRHASISPQLLLQSMRLAHPAFRGYAQQDSQEFLRCFMDQLHEELKRPIPLGDEDDLGGVGDNGGGDDSGGQQQSKTADDADLPLSSSSASLAAAAATPLATAATAAASSVSAATASPAVAGGGGDEAAAVGVNDFAATASGDSAAASTSAAVKPAKRRIRRFKSIISDTFNGSLVSTVQCSTCERLSSTLEVFQDLSLPIPSGDHLAVVQKKSGGHSGYGQSWWVLSALAYAAWPLYWMRSFVMGPRVSLQDCLAAFFSSDDLKGENMYHCGKCGKLRNGVKSSGISRLPEMLTVHLKRFRHDFMFSSKIGSHVAFPIEGLDMKPYLHRDCRASQTLYDLTAVVCHHGSTLGGHYTTFALNHAGMQWHEFDDSRVRPVDVAAVENCQAYVLFYRKRDEWMQQLRMRVSDIMKRQTHTSSLMPFYISRPWLNKFNTFGDPGPISNEDFLCPHQLLSPHAADSPDDIAMQLPYAAWDMLMKEFGGGPTVNRLGPCPECLAELQRTKDRAEQELATFKREMQPFQRGGRSSGSVCLISMRWFRRWESFATMRNLEPPGPIDNTTIAVRRGNRVAVRANSDYAQVPGRLWRYLFSVYGGGPEIRYGSVGRGGGGGSGGGNSSSSSRSSNSGSDSEAGGVADGEVRIRRGDDGSESGGDDSHNDNGGGGGGGGGGEEAIRRESGKIALDDADKD